MNTEELYEKWEKKIDALLRPKRKPIPEIDIKQYLKSEFFELSMDIDIVFQLSNEKVSLCAFVTRMINYGIKKHSKSGGGNCFGNPKKLPDLDFYDNQRDRYRGGNLAKYQGSFGMWPNEN